MRILMLAPQPFFEPRGTPISVYQRLEALSSLGHHVDLVTYHMGTDVHIPNVSVYRTPAIWFITSIKIGPSWAKPILDFLLFFLALLKLLTRRYDAIHSHEEAAFFAAVLGSLFRIPHIYDMHSSLPRQLHNFDVGNWRPLIRIFQWLERRTLESCHAVITIDAELEQYVYTVNPGVRQVRIENRAIPAKLRLVDSVLISQLKNNTHLASQQLIVYTGTFERYQGIELLLQSARIVKEQNHQAKFVLVGGKPDQIESFRTLAAREGVEDSIIFVGIVTPDEAIAFLDIADVLVSPRTGGAFAPLKIYSYLFAGKPTVATRIPAHANVLNEDIALLVEPNKEALAEGILYLLANATEREELGKRARQHATERYNATDYTSRLEHVYRFVRAVDSVGPRTTRQLEQSEI